MDMLIFLQMLSIICLRFAGLNSFLILNAVPHGVSDYPTPYPQAAFSIARFAFLETSIVLPDLPAYHRIPYASDNKFE